MSYYGDASEPALPFFLAGEADLLALWRGERDRVCERVPERLRDLQTASYVHNTSNNIQ